MATLHQIRKYANRRLYDATDSRHVTLEDLQKLLVAGHGIRVVDDRSGEDLTRPVLLQILAEQEQLGMPVLSTELLQALIRIYGSPAQALLTRYLEQSIGVAMRQQEILQAEMTKALSSPFAPVAELTRRNFELWTTMQSSLLATMAPGVAAKVEPAPGGSAGAAGKRKR